MDDAKIELAGRLAAQLRVDSIRCSTEAAPATQPRRYRPPT